MVFLKGYNKEMKKRTIALIICINIFFLLAGLSGCGSSNSEIPTEGIYTSLSELTGKRIGVQTGSIFDRLTEEKLTDPEIFYFSSFPDIVVALKTNKIDALPNSRMVLSQYLNTDDSLALLDEEIGEIPAAYLFPKNDKGKALRDQMSEYLIGLRERGELKEIEEMWCGKDESKKPMIDYRTLPADNGTLTFLTEGTFPPYSYIRDDLTVGYDVDIAARFCKEYGYGLNIVTLSFEALMPAVTSGKCDFAASGISITAERAESVYFSEPNIHDRIVFAVLKKSGGAGTFLESLKSSFKKTFLDENRYRMFLKGIGVTLIINVLSLIFGTLLGFVLYLLFREGNRVINKIISVFAWLIRGMPGVVLLMLLYYVIFGKISIGGMTVAVIAFTMTFGIAMYGMLISGVNAVDPGQTKAGYALGFDDRSTFLHLILPQAAQHFMPSYKGEIVALIKASAIVGYIAVADLTRMGDLIRSRTYEPFFPIISVAVIYFVLAGILTAITNLVIRGINPKKRTKEKILKGIKTHD